MNYNGQIILQGPLYLLPERNDLVIQATLVPVEVQANLTYSYITVRPALLLVIVKDGL